jgi:iron(III) transport system permease protein
MWNSAALAAIATVGTVLVGFLLAFCHRHIGGVWATAFLRISSIGYALPGTVLALGMLGPMAWFDGLLSTMLGWVGINAGLLLSGSAGALVVAYMLRFMTIPVNTLESGYGRIPYSVDDAARGLGAPDRALALRLHVPLLTPAGAAAALLVLIDCMKELPATLLLRPLNVDTLATALYGEASRGTYEDGAVAALAIVLVGMVPVILLVRGIRPQQARQPRGGLRVHPGSLSDLAKPSQHEAD